MAKGAKAAKKPTPAPLPIILSQGLIAGVREDAKALLAAVREQLGRAKDPRQRAAAAKASDEDIARLILLSEPREMALKLSQGKWVAARHLDFLSQAIHDAVRTPGGGRLIVSMPRRHGKSELCSHWTPAWFLARWPDHKVILTSYETTYAETWGGKVRDTLTQWGPQLGVALKDDSTAKGKWDTLVGGGMVAVGAGGALMGRGAHLFIVDDPYQNWEAAQSETLREKLWEWFQVSVLGGLEPNGTVILIMTRWHKEDLVGKILESADGASWNYIKLPALAGPGDAIGREVGEPLWLERHPLEAVERQKALWDPRIWAAIAQQEPSLIEGDLIKRSWWRYYNPASLPPLRPGSGEHWERLIQSWDTSFSGSATSDYVVGQVWGLWKGKLYLVDQERARMDFPTTCDAIRAMSMRWPEAKAKLIEQSANGWAIIQTLQHEVKGIVPVGVRAGQSKLVRLIGRQEERTHAVSTLIRGGLVHLPDPAAEDASVPKPTLGWVKGFVDECAAFTGVGDQQDDMVDSMTQGLRVLQPSTWVPQPQEEQPQSPQDWQRKAFWDYVRELRKGPEEGGQRERYAYLNASNY